MFHKVGQYVLTVDTIVFASSNAAWKNTVWRWAIVMQVRGWKRGVPVNCFGINNNFHRIKAVSGHTKYLACK